MKQIILSLIASCSIYAAQAQSCVSVQQVSTNYAAKQITFDLKWGTCNNTNHLYRVWVFVDYRPVTITTKGVWGRAVIIATDKGTLVSANKGVWVTGSANATQRVTLTLDVIGDKFDWCAFATDCPPQAIYSNERYTLKGTPPFTLTTSNGATVTGNTTYTGCITAITDATNCPGNAQPCCVGVRDQAVNGGVCCSGLTAVGGYCRDLVADASTFIPCGTTTLEVKQQDQGVFSWANRNQCPGGWRLPSFPELKCMWNNRSAINLTTATSPATRYWGSCVGKPELDCWEPTCTLTLGKCGCGTCSQSHGPGTTIRYVDNAPGYVRCVR